MAEDLLNPQPTEQQTVSLTTPPEENTISLAMSGSPYQRPLPAEIVQSRAMKANMGMGELLNKSYSDIHTLIANGSEDGIRNEAASKTDQQQTDYTQQKIKEMANQRGGSLSYEEVQGIISQNKPTNPNSVLEQHYAKAVTDTLDDSGNSTFRQASEEVPNSTALAKQRGNSLLAARERAVTEAQNLQTQMGQQSTLGYVWDTAKTFFQPYNEYEQRGLVDKMYGGGGLASNMDAQTSKLLMKSQDEQNAFWEGPEWTHLKSENPQLAMQFLQSYLGQTTEERTLGDLFTFMAVPDYYSIGKGIGGISRAIMLRNAANQAAKGTIQGAMLPHVTPAVIKEAAGDSTGAAVEHATQQVLEDVQGTVDLNKRAIEALPSALRIDPDKMQTKVPGREIVNRLVQQDREVLLNKLTDYMASDVKVNRTPELTAAKGAMKEIIEEQRQNFRGPANMLGDSNGFMYDARSNTYWVEHQVKDVNGDFFKTYEQARGAGEKNVGAMVTPKSYVDSLTNRIGELESELGTHLDENLRPISNIPQDADVHELNRYANMEAELDALHREKLDVTRRGPEGYPIKQNGAGYYISWIQPLKENSLIVQNILGKGKDAELPDAWIQGALPWIRTPMETLPEFDRQQRTLATHGPAVLLDILTDAAKPIKKLPGKYWEDWKRAIEFNQKDIDPKTGKPGRFFEDQSQMDSWYISNSKDKRLPSDQEVRAYWTYTGLSAADRELRISQEFLGKAVLGAEQHRFQVLDKDGRVKYSPFIEGMQRTEPPGGENTVMVVGDREGEERLYRATNLPKNIREDRAYSTIEIYNPDKYPLDGWGAITKPNKQGLSPRVHWIMTKKPQSKPLSYGNQIGFAGGGHLTPEYPYYIKQADVVHDPVSDHANYRGDKTFVPVSNRKMGEEYAAHMNNIADLLDKGKVKEAQEYHRVNGLDMKWDDVEKWFNSSHDPKGNVVRPRFSTKEKFRVVPANGNITGLDKQLEDQHGIRFRDRTKTGSAASQNIVEFTGERDAYEHFAVDNQGTQSNPIWQYQPAKMIDPMTSLNRGLARIINSSYINDYKRAGVKRFMALASDHLDVSREDLAHSPFYYYKHANEYWKPTSLKENAQEINNLKVYKHNIDQFVGVPSTVDNYISSVSAKLEDSIYGKLNSSTAGRFRDLSDAYYARNPFAFARAVTFHLAMGLFSIPQFFMQLSTATNVLAIGGARHMPSSMTATFLYQMLRHNPAPEIVAHFDNLATGMQIPGTSKWKPGEFTEFYKFLKESGFEHIGGEHAFLDTPWGAKVVKSLGGDILDWGEAPFRAGARNTRILSMATAYREFREGAMKGRTIFGTEIERKGSATGRLTREDKAAIMARASDLDHNMSRAANSSLHTGVASPIGQFTAYSLRLAELMTGKRLTWQEKARLFGVSSVLYGLPVGGLGLFGFPIGEYLKSKAQEAGHLLGDNFIESFIGDGLPSAVMQQITGKGYNFERFGAKGWDPADKFLFSDSPFLSIFGGAAFSKFGEMLV